MTNVRNAMDKYESATCLRFIESRHAHDRILFQSDDSSCYSTDVGRRGGRQKINLGPACNDGFSSTTSISLHEIGHAIGLFHEQMRPDRDRFVRVLSQNIQSGKGHNFDKESWHNVDNQGLYYDYASIMHYGKAFFSKNGQDTLQRVFGGSLGGSTD
eukprot:CAMPEP_0113970322 /NCGR_PEP_ID=MMETSP0011_2-20120614/11065_1 /TAXON_ID=101924 /ORGANISM="Rhodosorus marinus" /LENGTH=156 /DNA_ID=CAMNT_0000984591 /DNA_START=48 /DNA_END=515 /DNA_ORIENTATION=- /assembly_acc=CAM_ASM_000156